MTDAVTWATRFDAAINTRDWPAVSALLSEEMTFESHRRAVRGQQGGHQEFLTQAASWVEMGMRTSNTPIDRRGDHLVLLDTLHTHDDGFNVQLCSLVEVNSAGMAVYLGAWDEQDLAAATVELDRRAIGTVG